MSSNKNRFKEVTQWFFIASFLVFMLIPGFVTTFGIDSHKYIQENRNLAPKPTFRLNNIFGFASEFDKYFGDHFGMRHQLIIHNSSIKSSLFKWSSNTAEVAYGRNGWLFITGNQTNIFKPYTNRNLLTEKELAQNQITLENRRRKLHSEGISYYKAFWPNKHSIYEEEVPFMLRIRKQGTLNKVDQVINYLREHQSNIEILDVRGELLRLKDSVQLYYKYDSHWNQLGAFIGYSALFKEMAKEFPELKPRSRHNFDIIQNEDPLRGTLVYIGIARKKWNNYHDIDFEFRPKFRQDSIIITKETQLSKRTILHHNISTSNTQTLLIFRDSFSNALIQFIDPHFKKVYYVWTDYDQEMVDKIKPDIVVEGCVERYF